jgi:hypothetical protein
METQPNFSVRMGEKNLAYKLVVSTTVTTTTTKKQQKQQSWIATFVSVETKAKPMSTVRQTAHSWH